MFVHWIHLLALSVYLGCLLGLWLVLLPSGSALKDHSSQIGVLVHSLKRYNPIQTAALGILVMTGAFQVTDLKETHRALFAREFGTILALKLLLSFVIIVLGTYQSMGLAHRFVRSCEAGISVSPRELGSLTGRLRSSTIVIVFLMLITVVVAIKM